MANINNTSSYMDEDKKQIIKESNYTFRDALEVSSYLIEVGKQSAGKEFVFYDCGADNIAFLQSYSTVVKLLIGV